ncbi:MAG: DUF4174 domain-containing protein [Pseudomonadota bacterium]
MSIPTGLTMPDSIHPYPMRVPRPAYAIALLVISLALPFLNAHAQTKNEAAQALANLFKNQTPVEDLIGDYRLLIVGGPGLDNKKKQRLWKKQLKKLSTLSAGAQERRLLVLNDSSRSDNPAVDKRTGAVTLRMTTQSGQTDKVLEALIVDLRSRQDIRPKIGQGWQAILVGLDGTIKARWDKIVKEKDVFKIIDAMPMRQQELRNQ